MPSFILIRARSLKRSGRMLTGRPSARSARRCLLRNWTRRSPQSAQSASDDEIRGKRQRRRILVALGGPLPSAVENAKDRDRVFIFGIDHHIGAAHASPHACCDPAAPVEFRVVRQPRDFGLDLILESLRGGGVVVGNIIDDLQQVLPRRLPPLKNGTGHDPSCRPEPCLVDDLAVRLRWIFVFKSLLNLGAKPCVIGVGVDRKPRGQSALLCNGVKRIRTASEIVSPTFDSRFAASALSSSSTRTCSMEVREAMEGILIGSGAACIATERRSTVVFVGFSFAPTLRTLSR